MSKDRTQGGGVEPVAGAIPLGGDRTVLKQYYARLHIPSPMGGFLEVLGTRSLADGSALILFECSASSLRYELVLPKGTRRDREKVLEQVNEGEDPNCPRCRDRFRLVRAGKNLHCPCGVDFGKAV